MTLPTSVILLDDETEAIATGLRKSLPGLKIHSGGAEPTSPYAIIAFAPGKRIANYPNADWVHVSGAGANFMIDDLQAHDLRPAMMTRTLGQMGKQIAEYVLSYFLADAQRHTTRASLQAAQTWDRDAALPTLIRGQRAIIFGTGGIGRTIATTLSYLGVSCTGVNRSGSLVEGFANCIAATKLPMDVSGFDICINALPHTPQTQGTFDHALLSAFQSCFFINIGRGSTVVATDLLTALTDGSLRHAILDVFEIEPLPANSQLWTHPAVTITPHVSGLTLPQDTVEAFVAAYHALKNGTPVPLRVDPTRGY